MNYESVATATAVAKRILPVRGAIFLNWLPYDFMDWGHEKMYSIYVDIVSNL